MSAAADKRLAAAVLERHGEMYSAELGVDLARNTPSPLFRWLCASLLMSARISGAIMRAATALADHGWTTAQKMAESTWRQRVTVLNRAGYARYDESTSRMLGDTAQLLLDQYGGDLRRLRDRAERRPDEERRLLKAFKGVGDVGVDIFFREVQIAWDELHPFADKRSLEAAERIGLPSSAEALAELVSRRDFPRLLAGLTRMAREKDLEAILETVR